MKEQETQLREAFEHFNSVTGELIQAYQLLELQVAELNRKLEQANDELVEKSAANARLAEKLSALLAVMPVGVIELDEQGCVLTINDSAHDLLPEMCEGEVWQQVAVLGEAGPDGVFVREVAGSVRHITLLDCPLQQQGAFLLLVDVSNLQLLHQQLAQQERLASMGRMAASLAHQVRTPLAAALLYAANLKRDDLNQEGRVRFAGKVVDRLQALERLVQDMLSFVRSGQAPGLPELLPVGQLVQEVESVVLPLLQRRGVHWRRCGNEEGTLSCVHSDLVGAMVNLIENACEYSPPGGVVTLLAECCDGEVMLQVADQGAGVPEEVVAQMFDPFFTTRANGTGLGLAIVKRVVEDMNGAIVYSRISAQTVFEMKFRAAMSAE